jgi:hypothetical protein
MNDLLQLGTKPSIVWESQILSQTIPAVADPNCSVCLKPKMRWIGILASNASSPHLQLSSGAAECDTNDHSIASGMAERQIRALPRAILHSACGWCRLLQDAVCSVYRVRTIQWRLFRIVGIMRVRSPVRLLQITVRSILQLGCTAGGGEQSHDCKVQPSIPGKHGRILEPGPSAR